MMTVFALYESLEWKGLPINIHFTLFVTLQKTCLLMSPLYPYSAVFGWAPSIVTCPRMSCAAGLVWGQFLSHGMIAELCHFSLTCLPACLSLMWGFHLKGCSKITATLCNDLQGMMAEVLLYWCGILCLCCAIDHLIGSHYLRPCWPSSVPSFNVTRPQWVK